MRQKLKKHVSDFMKCGLMGWGMECFWTGCGSLYEKKDRQMHCMTSLWMFPIYGMASMLTPLRLRLHGMYLFDGVRNRYAPEKKGLLPLGLQRGKGKLQGGRALRLRAPLVRRRPLIRETINEVNSFIFSFW